MLSLGDVLILVLSIHAASAVFNVVPSSDDCLSTDMSCLTLNKLASNTSHHVGNSSNITILFQPGDHYLATSLVIINKESISLLSTTATRSTNTSIRIHCSNSSSVIFSRIAHVHIGGVHFAKCKGHRFFHIEHLHLEKSIFCNHSSTALSIKNTTARLTLLIVSSRSILLVPV